MFCKWCGENISGNTVTVCPSCGKEQGPLMSGNGFWDLCTIDPATGIAKVLPVTDVTSDEETSDIRSHIEGNDESLQGEARGVSSNAICKKGLSQFILKQRYVELCLVIVLFLNLLTSVLNLICWPMLFVRQMEQHGADEKIYIEEGLSDIRNTLNEIDNAFTEKEEPFSSQSPQGAIETSEIVVYPEESDVPEETESEESDATTLTGLDSATPKLMRYIVNEEEGLYLYAVEGIPNRINNCLYYWQTSEDGGETWVPLSNGSRYVVISPKENEEYRVIVSSEKIYLVYFSS